MPELDIQAAKARREALAKWRGEALRDCATAVHSDRMHEGEFKDCERWGCSAAHAAIDATPEQALKREKERQSG